MKQSRKEMKKNIQRASRHKILRRQMELLAEYCRISGQGQVQIPECSKEMVRLQQELLKTERILFVRFLVTLFTLLYLVKRIPVKGIEFIK